MEIAVFDIETIPAQSIPDESIPQFNPADVKLGNLKDPIKIAEKIESARQSWESELTKKMSLDPDLCEVCCFVGMRYFTENNQTGATTIKSGDPESVEAAWDFIRLAYHNFVPLVSYNGIGFDLPVLLRRAMLTGHYVQTRLYQDLTKRYSIKSHIDLMQVMAEWDRTRWKSLNFYLQRFGIGTKTGDGGDVYGLWKESKRQQIEDYCRNDVEMTAKLFSRLEKWVVDIPHPEMDKPF